MDKPVVDSLRGVGEAPGLSLPVRRTPEEGKPENEPTPTRERPVSAAPQSSPIVASVMEPLRFDGLRAAAVIAAAQPPAPAPTGIPFVQPAFRAARLNASNPPAGSDAAAPSLSTPSLVKPSPAAVKSASEPAKETIAASTTEAGRATPPLQAAPSHLSNPPAPAAPQTTAAHPVPQPVPQPVPVKVKSLDGERLVASLRGRSSGGVETLEMQLRPEALGRALAIIRRTAERIELEFQIERPEAREAVRAEAGSLKEALAAAGFANVAIEIKAPESRPNDPDLSAGDRRSNSSGGEQREQSPERRREFAETRERPVSRRLGYNSFELFA